MLAAAQGVVHPVQFQGTVPHHQVGAALLGVLFHVLDSPDGIVTPEQVRAVIQKVAPTDTTVLVVGFVTANVMTLTQSVGVIMGANIGSTMTAQIVAFNVTQYALVMVAIASESTSTDASGVAGTGAGMLVSSSELRMMVELDASFSSDKSGTGSGCGAGDDRARAAPTPRANAAIAPAAR